MTGHRHGGFVIQDRDRHLLSEVSVMRVIDREMTKVVAGFTSTTATNLRLLALVRAGLLRRFFIGSVANGRKAVYTLSLKGTDLVNAKLGGIVRPQGRLLVGDRFVAHQIGINQIYLAVKYRNTVQAGIHLIRWIVFRGAISETIRLTPDGYFELGTGEAVASMFVEVDLGTEALSVWKQKTASYVQLAVSGEFQRRFRQSQFRVLVVAASERRLANIRATVFESTDKIFRFTTFDNIHRDGFWSPIWLRPTGGQRQSLL
jgi:hypothetical protein